MMKKEKPKNGTDAVSKRVVTNITPRVIGKKKVNSKKKQMIYPWNLCFLFFMAVPTETKT